MSAYHSSEMLPVAQAIRKHLPDGWTAHAPDTHDNGVYFRGPDSIELHMKYAQGRYEITGVATREEIRQKRSGEGPRPITVAASKSPAQIAGDIRRRLLPGWIAHVTALRERVATHHAYERRTRSFRDELLRVLGKSGHPLAHDENTIYLLIEDGYGSIRVSGDTVYFERFSVHRALALEIARVLASDGER